MMLMLMLIKICSQIHSYLHRSGLWPVAQVLCYLHLINLLKRREVKYILRQCHGAITALSLLLIMLGERS